MSQIFGTRMVRAVDDVTLSIPRGSILGLVGESGCGKSTLSRAIMQLQPVTSGRIVLDGTELTALLLADEPVSALDVSIQSQILNLLTDLVRDMGITMIFISHDLGVVHYLADDIAVMRRGRLVEYGTADAVFHHPQAEYTRALLAAVPTL